ncbi:MAG: hypothetical protein KatS3mg105_2690 [Gemmatales bacterium]|nr:MAG: hypothetical protein KatS3mg105_2690 [Gemmatales bacterium]
MVCLVKYLGATVGHAVLWVYAMNLLYSTAWPRPLLRVCRRILEPLILSAPILFYFGYGYEVSSAVVDVPWQQWLRAYGGFCCVLGLGVFPVVTVRRLLQKMPVALRSNHSTIVDMASSLGYPPRGRSKRRWMTYLPYNQVFEVEFSEKTIALPNLPGEWEGLSILHLSDLHFCGTPDRRFFAAVIERCMEQPPDLVAVTGDIVDSHHHHRWILPVLGKLKWRIAAFAILGNHDAWYDPRLSRRRIERLGIVDLGNSWTQIDVRGKPMVVIGNETPWFRPAPNLEGCPPDVFKLCLSHTPDNITWAKANGVDLLLAGHNHGGQIRFPLVGSVFVPSRFSRRYDCGTFEEQGVILHVSRGLGGQHPVRYHCRPEVTRLILTQAASTS